MYGFRQRAILHFDRSSEWNESFEACYAVQPTEYRWVKGVWQVFPSKQQQKAKRTRWYPVQMQVEPRC